MSYTNHNPNMNSNWHPHAYPYPDPHLFYCAAAHSHPDPCYYYHSTEAPPPVKEEAFDDDYDADTVVMTPEPDEVPSESFEFDFNEETVVIGSHDKDGECEEAEDNNHEKKKKKKNYNNEKHDKEPTIENKEKKQPADTNISSICTHTSKSDPSVTTLSSFSQAENIKEANKENTYKEEDNSEWNMKFKELCEYKRLNGHTNVHYKHVSLGHWVQSQRTRYKATILHQYRLKKAQQGYKKILNDSNNDKNHGQDCNAANDSASSPSILTSDQIKALESIDFQLTFKSRSWEDHYQELVKFRETHGHAIVPQRHKVLGGWVMNQRRQYKLFEQNKQSPMTQERVDKLNAIQFQWVLYRSEEGKAIERFDWNHHFKELVQFKMENNGSMVVPRKTRKRLWNWVRTQRYNYRKILKKNGGKIPHQINLPKSEKCSLDAHRIKMLDCIGFQWVVRESPKTETR